MPLHRDDAPTRIHPPLVLAEAMRLEFVASQRVVASRFDSIRLPSANDTRQSWRTTSLSVCAHSMR
ncbi:MAG: hypothetical protein ACKO2D_06685, partial [Chloroflexota bacterium]